MKHNFDPKRFVKLQSKVREVERSMHGRTDALNDEVGYFKEVRDHMFDVFDKWNDEISQQIKFLILVNIVMVISLIYLFIK
jgi:hypothetical protein